MLNANKRFPDIRPSSPLQSCPACIIDTRGYDFSGREGHQNPAGHREELMMDSRFGEAALSMTLAALVFGFATATPAQGKWRARAARPPGPNARNLPGV